MKHRDPSQCGGHRAAARIAQDGAGGRIGERLPRFVIFAVARCTLIITQPPFVQAATPGFRSHQTLDVSAGIGAFHGGDDGIEVGSSCGAAGGVGMEVVQFRAKGHHLAADRDDREQQAAGEGEDEMQGTDGPARRGCQSSAQRRSRL